MSDDSNFNEPDFLDVLKHVKEIREAIDDEFDGTNVIRVDFAKREKVEEAIFSHLS